MGALEKTIGEAFPDAEIHSFMDTAEMLEFAQETACDIAFMDIQMPETDGIVLAKQLQGFQPRINIVFVTAYMEYTMDALALFASGYLLKPVSAQAVVKQVKNLRYPIQKMLTVQTFGHFEVFSGGTPIGFARSKTKELFAYLVSRRGAECTNSEIVSVLWEGEADSRGLQSHLRNLVSDLFSVLKSVGAEEVVCKKRGKLSVVPDLINCEYYDFHAGDTGVMQKYAGEFMSQYSWAETINAYLRHSNTSDF